MIPWDAIEEEYAGLFPSECGILLRDYNVYPRFTDVANTEQLLRIIQFRYNKKEGPIGPSSDRRHRKFLQPDHCCYMRTDNCCKYIAKR